MANWRIDKSSKIPLYLQLMEFIKTEMAEGAVVDRQRLPGVNSLGRMLGINFETARKAYKELEKEGLVSMERGRGTFATVKKSRKKPSRAAAQIKTDGMASLRALIGDLLADGLNRSDIRSLFEEALLSFEPGAERTSVLFCECSPHRLEAISGILKEGLDREVETVLLRDLRSAVLARQKRGREIPPVITSGFHAAEVRALLDDLPVKIHCLVLNMSPETRQSLKDLGRETWFGLVAGSPDLLPFHEDVMMEEIGGEARIRSCAAGNPVEVDELIDACDAILATPDVLEIVEERVRGEKPVFNVYDRVDPFSLKVIAERIQEMTG